MLKSLFSSFFGFNPKFRIAGCVDYFIGTLLSNILFVLAIATAIIEFIWRPIDCHVPATFTDAMEQYAESYCQWERTYWTPFVDYVPSGYSTQDTRKLRYEWRIPLLFLVHAVILKLPRFVEFILSKLSNVHLSNLIKSAACYRTLDESGKKSMARTVANLLYSNYSIKSTTKSGLLAWIRKLVAVVKRYLPFGILSIVSILVILSYALQSNYAFNELGRFLHLGNTTYDYGWEYWKKLHSEFEEDDDSIFPSTIMCDYEVKQLGLVHRHTVMCLLPMKRFYDTLFFVLWSLYLAAQTLAWVALAGSIITALFPLSRRWFIKRCLKMQLNALKQNSKNRQFAGAQSKSYQVQHDLREFTRNHLLTDAYFVLKSLAQIDDLFIYDVVNQLWSDVNPECQVTKLMAGEVPPTAPTEKGRLLEE